MEPEIDGADAGDKVKTVPERVMASDQDEWNEGTARDKQSSSLKRASDEEEDLADKILREETV
jgi:hypothetical protein